MLKKIIEKFSSKSSKEEKYLESNSKFIIRKTGKTKFIKFIKQMTKNEISELLGELRKNKFEIAFHDTEYPKSDDGAYFSYSIKKTIGKEYWSMTYGNDGWSGGIYHLRKETIVQQIFNLANKGKLAEIQIT